MENSTVITILKWIGLVFAAGFIGYFGKYLSKIIIAKIHRQKKSTEIALTIDNSSTKKEKLDYKIEKKRVKLEKKKLKKKNK